MLLVPELRAQWSSRYGQKGWHDESEVDPWNAVVRFLEDACSSLETVVRKITPDDYRCYHVSLSFEH